MSISTKGNAHNSELVNWINCVIMFPVGATQFVAIGPYVKLSHRQIIRGLRVVIIGYFALFLRQR